MSFGSKAGIVAGKAFIVLEAIDRTGRVLNSVRQQFARFGAEISAMGQQALMTGLAALTPGTISLKVFADFDDSMRKVEARSTGTAAEMAKIREQALMLGRTTSFTARQIGELQAVLAQRGFNRGQILDMTTSVMNLARAGGSGNREQDILVSADLITGTLRSFDLSAKDSVQVANMLTTAVNNSNFSLIDLISSISNAGPIVNRYKGGMAGLAETISILAAMRNVNIDPSVAGTGLRNLLLKASDKKNRDEFNQTLKEMTGNTIEFVDEMGNLKDPSDILFSINRAMKGLGTAEQGFLLSELFGLRAIVPAGALAAAEQDFVQMMTMLDQMGNVAEETAKKMDAGIGGMFRILLSAVEGMMLSLGDALSNVVITIGRGLTTVFDKISVWIQDNSVLVAQLHVGVAIATVYAAAVVALGRAFSLAAFMMRPFLAALALLQTSVLLVKTVIMRLTVVIVGTLAAVIGTVVSIMTSVIGVLVGWAMSLTTLTFGALVPAFLAWYGAVILIGVGLGMLVAKIIGLMGYTSVIKDSFNSITSAVASAWQRIKELGATIAQTIGSATEALMSGQMELAWEIALTGMRIAWLQLQDMITMAWHRTMNYIKDTAVRVVMALNEAWSYNPFSDEFYNNRNARALRGMLTDGTYTPEQRSASEARQREISALQTMLDFLDSLIDPSLVPGYSDRNAIEGTPEAYLEDLVNQGKDMKEYLKAPSPIDGLEKGSIRAAEQFYKNFSDAERKKLELLEEIASNTRPQPDAPDAVGV